jgi:hypothetical protein
LKRLTFSRNINLNLKNYPDIIIFLKLSVFLTNFL